MFKYCAAILVILCCAATTTAMAASPPVQFFPVVGPARQFSSAVRIGNMVYVSGTIGVGSDGTLPADFSTQATNAMNAIGGELKRAGASMDDVFACDVSLADMKNWSPFNAIYQKYFKPDRLPVRMASGANGLAMGAAVEVQCQAYMQQ